MILYKIILAFHIIVCFALIIVVLLQSSKGGGLAGAFGGGGGSQTIFGGQETATFLSKATTYLAVLFMVLSLSLAFLTSRSQGRKQESVLRRAATGSSEVIPQGESIDEVLGSAAVDSASAGAKP
ncbi:MAG: preprotein translocase subunit SecG [Chitinivibrionia bacterium]|nr:preprotein translocase subunit SecG [Chitinivibrionia bacterium]